MGLLYLTISPNQSENCIILYDPDEHVFKACWSVFILSISLKDWLKSMVPSGIAIPIEVLMLHSLWMVMTITHIFCESNLWPCDIFHVGFSFRTVHEPEHVGHVRMFSLTNHDSRLHCRREVSIIHLPRASCTQVAVQDWSSCKATSRFLFWTWPWRVALRDFLHAHIFMRNTIPKS